MSQSVNLNVVRKLAIGVTALLLFLLLVPSLAFAADSYTVKVNSGYLALRTAPSYNANNEIGELYTGDIVDLQDSTSNATYWKVYSQKYGRSGWVNKNYLVHRGGTAQGDYRVKVDKNYLALRTAPAYDWYNEIGKLYTGDTVTLYDTSNGQYWWVYSPKYDTYGYVNKGYIYPASSYEESYSVRVNTGYLALRTKAAYDTSNEIGKLYTGDTVTVKAKNNGQYWWVYSPKLGKEGYVNKAYLV